jgi:hypothetical protein
MQVAFAHDDHTAARSVQSRWRHVVWGAPCVGDQASLPLCSRDVMWQDIMGRGILNELVVVFLAVQVDQMLRRCMNTVNMACAAITTQHFVWPFLFVHCIDTVKFSSLISMECSTWWHAAKGLFVA